MKARGKRKIPKIPITLKPIQILIKVARADKPIRSPRTLGSMALRTTVIVIKRTMSPTPKKILPLMKEIMDHGTSTEPVPRMGRMSTMIIRNDMTAEYLTPRIERPIKLRMKVTVLKIS
jgi:hypothetical protein